MGGSAHLTRIPPEILHQTLSWLDPADLASVSLVCQQLHSFVEGNQRLWHDVYLLHFDTPSDKTIIKDWASELRDIVKLEKILSKKDDLEEEANQLPFVCDTVTRLLRTASYNNNGDPQASESPRNHVSRNSHLLQRLFEANPEAKRVFTQQSTLFQRISARLRRVKQSFPPQDKSQLSAKLHCLLGQPVQQIGKTRAEQTYPWACSTVYDIRTYSNRSHWGPFMDDGSGRVDWEKLEAISIILWKNARDQTPPVTAIFAEQWTSSLFTAFPHSYAPLLRRPISPLDASDPYGVGGSYHRIVCFLDHRDFRRFNFMNLGFTDSSHPRQPLNMVEASRFIAMELRVTRVEPPGPDDGQELPVVHFEGVSSSVEDIDLEEAQSTLQGSVRLTRDGEVRWQSVSSFRGEERWRSEGIQIGGVGSLRGVFGTWFDSSYEPTGPVGPTMFWKAGGVVPSLVLPSATSNVALQPGEATGTAPFGDHGEDYDDDDDEEDFWGGRAAAADDWLPGLRLVITS